MFVFIGFGLVRMGIRFGIGMLWGLGVFRLNFLGFVILVLVFGREG